MTALYVSLYGGIQIEKTLYFVISCSILIFVHKLGHLAATRCLGLKVHALKISGAGGLCVSEPPDSYRSALLFFNGGLIAQVILFGLTRIYLSLFSYPDNRFGLIMVMTFTLVNVMMFIINIIPGKQSEGLHTDGYVLWQLIRRWRNENF